MGATNDASGPRMGTRYGMPALPSQIRGLGDKEAEEMSELVRLRMGYAEAWYWCDITEDEREEPDWSKVPAERRAMVKGRWDAVEPTTKRWKLWGPQIALYERTEGMQVAVVGLV